MPVQISAVRCPLCEAPLVVQRAAPGDAEVRVACAGCGADYVVGEGTMQDLRLAPRDDARPLILAA